MSELSLENLKMIKFSGPNYYQGDGDEFILGNFYGNGSGEGISSYIFYYNSYSGDGIGDGDDFGNGEKDGDGSSYGPKLLKKEFNK